MKIPASLKALKLVAKGESFKNAKQQVKDRRLAKSLAEPGLDKKLFDKAEKRARLVAWKPKDINEAIIKHDAIYFLDHPGAYEAVMAKHCKPKAAAAPTPAPAPKAKKQVRFAEKQKKTVRFNDDVAGCLPKLRGKATQADGDKVSVTELVHKLEKKRGKQPDR